MLDSQFGSNTGNCYKPDGTNLKSFIMSTMEKKNNEELADYSDVQNFIIYLNASSRISDNTQWRYDLESVFDVDNFMKWLAVNTVIQNWDTYGKMTHNFYLYNDPATAKLVWIPRDNNGGTIARETDCPESFHERSDKFLAADQVPDGYT